MNIYKVDDGEIHLVAAEDEEQAVDFVREALGMTREQYVEEFEKVTATLMRDDDRVVIREVEPGDFSEEIERGGCWSLSARCDNLAKHHQPGVICSTIH